MALRTSTRSCLRFIRSSALASIGLLAVAQTVLGGGGFDLGTPAESRGGFSGLATYAQDKIETVSLTNGNLNVHIPLVTIGGRGSASYTIALNQNNKLWSAHTEIERRDDGFGIIIPVRHNTATFDDLLGSTPNTWFIGSGWSILLGPAIKVKRVDIDPINCQQREGDIFKYVLTKVWLVMPDGSEIEMRDDLTDGAPYFKPDVCANPGQPDRDRGRVWHSTDGRAITYVTDAANGVVSGLLTGYVFLPDGTRLRMNSAQGSGNAPCIRIIDPNANYVRINYNSPVFGAVKYTDQLGRDVILQGSGNNITITVKGYNGLLDRTITIVKNSLFPGDNTTPAPNLRSDYDVGGANFMPRPFISGDYENTSQGVNEHAIYPSTPHTDVIVGSDVYGGYTPVSDEPGAPGTGVYGVTQLNLLDGRSFTFRYNPWGQLAEIIYPAGGVSQIDYAPYGSFLCEHGTLNSQMNRRVVQRRNYLPGAGGALALDCKWTYGWGSQIVDGTSRPFAQIEARQGGSDALLMSEKHFFLALDSEYRQCGANGTTFQTGNPKFENGKEFKVERQIGGGQVQVEEPNWVNRATRASWVNEQYWQQYGQEQGDNDPRVTREDTTLENGKLKRVRYDYDDFNNVTRQREYDFGQSAQGTLVRETNRTYLGSQNGYCYTNLNGTDGSCGGAVYAIPDVAIHRRRLLLNETVTNSLTGAVEAYTEYKYDNYTNDGNHAGIQTNSGMIQYDGTWFSPFLAQSEPRGNVTSVKRLISGPIVGGTYATAYSQYDEAGNVVKTKDPRGNPTTVAYADNFGDGRNPDVIQFVPPGPTFALPTLVTNALGHQVKTQYDYTRGVTTGIKDANGVIAKMEYNEPYDRPTRVTAAYGLPEATKTEMSYPTASANESRVSKQLDSTRWLAYKTTYDGFGRPLTANEAEDGNHASAATFTIFSKRIYDGLGRVKFTTNPYRSTAANTDGWARSAYDLAGRVTEVATFSGDVNTQPPDSGTNANWTGSVTTSYASEVTTVTDQAGKVRRSITDGLGRLIRVDESNSSGSLGTVASPTQPTSYVYDALDDLTTVTQGTQPQRTFIYDSLKRLTDATNPESGLVHYTYDANSNLATKLDARGITTTYSYDALNRIQTRTYSGDPSNTPPVTYSYDAAGVLYSKGRLTQVTSSVSTCDYLEYDQLGRIKQSKQTTAGGAAQGYTSGYGYNLAGAMTTETYPSGRMIATEYDTAGRMAGVKKDATTYYAGGAPGTANAMSYTAHGAAATMRLGNGKWEHINYNSRLQPTQIGLGTSSADSSVLDLDYDFGTTANNGNVLSQRIVIAGAGGMDLRQNYSYDALNRLATATEVTTAGGAQQWQQTYDIDRWGNRAVRNTSYIPNSALTPQSLSPTDFSAFDQTNNRLKQATYPNVVYDNAGNLTRDQAARTFTYDAENRQLTFNTTTGQYFYDGDGRRVKKIDSSGTTVFVYNAGGQLIAEYHSDPVPPPAGGGGTSYLTSDHLGSTRVVTKADGSVKARYDYLPFGEELNASIGGRTVGMGYSAADSTKQKFTQKKETRNQDWTTSSPDTTHRRREGSPALIHLREADGR